jgi:hypothetical protein
LIVPLTIIDSDGRRGRTSGTAGHPSSIELAIWSLSIDSELVFAGDADTTEAGRPSHRYGMEWANYDRPRPWLVFDADLSLSRSRFTDGDPAGDEIPGSVQRVASLVRRAPL